MEKQIEILEAEIEYDTSRENRRVRKIRILKKLTGKRGNLDAKKGTKLLSDEMKISEGTIKLPDPNIKEKVPEQAESHDLPVKPLPIDTNMDLIENCPMCHEEINLPQKSEILPGLWQKNQKLVLYYHLDFAIFKSHYLD